jgi:hypothetical protein
MHHEYEAIEHPDEILQGDVIVWHDHAYAKPWRTYGIVVTADCDLAWGKHGGRLSFIPGLLTEDYLWHSWRAVKFGAECSKAVESMTVRINKWLEKNGRSPISIEAGRTWIERVQGEAVLNELGVVDRGERNTLQPVIDRAVAFASLLNASEPDMHLLRKCHALAKGNSASDDSLLAKAFQSAISDSPGDVFHLPVLPDRDDEGLFLMLRHISQCEVADITTRPDELRFGIAKAKRIARVTAPYRYAITQSLGRVFADIGLPKEYEDRCQSSAIRFFQSRVDK